MSRAVVVSTCNSTLFNYWYKNFKTWDKGYKLYVVNSKNDGKYPKGVERVLKEVKEDLILIMHDDVFVYEPAIIEEYFKIAEKKVVTPFQVNYNNIDKVNEQMKTKFGKIVSFYPYFLFISKENLKKTSITLSEYITDGCSVLECPLRSDQGFLLGLELLRAGVEFHQVQNYLGRQNPKNPPWLHVQGLSIGLLEKLDDHQLKWIKEIC